MTAHSEQDQREGCLAAGMDDFVSKPIETTDLEHVIEVRNYTEAAGVVMALKRGISLQSLARPLQTFRHKETVVEPEFIPAYAEAMVAQ